MSEALRGAVYLGSYPANNTKNAMLAMGHPENVGVPVRALPDGETGERGNWVQDEVAALVRQRPEVYRIVTGANTRYDNLDVLGVAEEAEFSVASISRVLQYANDAAKARNVLDSLKNRGLVRPDMPLLVGMPAPFDLTSPFGFVMDGQNLKYMDTISGALVKQIEKIQGDHPNPQDTIIQFETPVSLAAAAEHPYWPKSISTEAIAQSLTDAVAESPEGTQFALHICNGDLGGEANPVLMGTGTALGVRFAQLILQNWPAGRPLTRLHLPMSHGRLHPPSLEFEQYAPLAELQGALPEGARLAAGFAHPLQSPSDQLRLRDEIERRYNGLTGSDTVDIAYHCGQGRLSPQEAAATDSRIIELAKN